MLAATWGLDLLELTPQQTPLGASKLCTQAARLEVEEQVVRNRSAATTAFPLFLCLRSCHVHSTS